MTTKVEAMSQQVTVSSVVRDLLGIEGLVTFRDNDVVRFVQQNGTERQIPAWAAILVPDNDMTDEEWLMWDVKREEFSLPA